jgi:hypothetical protein
MFFYLLCSHFVCDYPLQSDFIAVGKSPKKGSLNGVPWPYTMAGHAFTHGAGVSMVTGSVVLGIAETVAHFIIDVLKCYGITNIHIDQALHIACKLAWWGYWNNR